MSVLPYCKLCGHDEHPSGDCLECAFAFGYRKTRCSQPAAQFFEEAERRASDQRTVAEPSRPSLDADAPDGAYDMCPNCVTPSKCNGPHLSEETVNYKRRVSTLSLLALHDADTEAAGVGDWEAFRKDHGWPTPNHMRSTADALDSLTHAKYGDILRWVADACDSALGAVPSHVGAPPDIDNLTIDVARLARAMETVYEEDLYFHRNTGHWDIDAGYIAAEYTRSRE